MSRALENSLLVEVCGSCGGSSSLHGLPPAEHREIMQELSLDGMCESQNFGGLLKLMGELKVFPP